MLKQTPNLNIKCFALLKYAYISTYTHTQQQYVVVSCYPHAPGVEGHGSQETFFSYNAQSSRRTPRPFPPSFCSPGYS